MRTLSFRKKKSPASWDRTNGNEAADNAQEVVRAAWRSLALAGAPRLPKSEREKRVSQALGEVDRARAHLTRARASYGRMIESVKAAEEHVRTSQERMYLSAETISEKAGVTILRPLIEGLTHDLRVLGECLARYRGGKTRRPPGSHEVEAQPYHMRLSGDPVIPAHRCQWCGTVEGEYRDHYGLDEAGYGVGREHARKFICRRCFCEGRDLAEPVPKPIPVAPEPPAPAEPPAEDVACVVHTQRILGAGSGAEE